MWPVLLLILCLFVPGLTRADEVILKSGERIRGNIIEQDKYSVTLELATGLAMYPKKSVLRIYDFEDLDPTNPMVFSKGHFPPWRVIINDIRSEDWVETVQQVPANVIRSGPFRNVPYQSFKVNDRYEVNIFGDPENPAGVEIGVYGTFVVNNEEKKRSRQFIMSYLTEIAQIKALRDLNQRGESRTVGDLTLKLTPPGAPDSHGGRWLTVYNPKELDRARLSDAEVARLSKPKEDIDTLSSPVAGNWRRDELQSMNPAKRKDPIRQNVFRHLTDDDNLAKPLTAIGG